MTVLVHGALSPGARPVATRLVHNGHQQLAYHQEVPVTRLTVAMVASQIADRNGWQYLVTVEAHHDSRFRSLWVEFAAPTHGGRCPDHPERATEPGWDWIEHGRVMGSVGRGKCYECGALDRGWVRSGAERVADDCAEGITALADLESRFAARLGEGLPLVQPDPCGTPRVSSDARTIRHALERLERLAGRR